MNNQLITVVFSRDGIVSDGLLYFEEIRNKLRYLYLNFHAEQNENLLGVAREVIIRDDKTSSFIVL